MERWKRDFAIVWVGQFLSILSFNLVWPFFPLYIQEITGSTATESAVWASILISSSSLLMAICGPMWGVLSDRYGRKAMVVRSMISGSVTLTMMGFAQTLWQVWVLRALQGVMTG